MTKVKICCISSVAEARLAMASGASALGLVSQMPSGPGVIPMDRIARIRATVPSTVATFLLTSRVTAPEIAAQQGESGADTIQICDRVSSHVYAEIRQVSPASLVQVIHVGGPESVDEALRASEHVDALLLDSGNQALDVKELGGTGRTHDWSLSARIVREANVPVFLAGGLNPDNVTEAIRTVRPHGVDVCSGVRTDGALDAGKLSRFFAAVVAAT